MQEVIKVENLVKQYGDLNAVDDVSFSIKEGHCFGLLGPNGAGKTTTIEIMEGIISATQGHVFYKGKPVDSAVSEQIGIQFQNTSLQDFLSVKETLSLFSAFYDKTISQDKLIALCDLSEFLNQNNRLLSGGQRQRLLLALALINDPDIIFLDEPTTGLDPQARRNFWQLIKNIKAEGKTIILTTHYMDEAEQLCDEVVIMDHGKIIESGTPEALLNKHFENIFIYLPLTHLSTELIKIFKGEVQGDKVEITTQHVEKTLTQLIEHSVSLEGLHVKSANLDDLFLKLTGYSLRD